MTKKILAICLACLTAASVTACGSKKKKDSNDTSTSTSTEAAESVSPEDGAKLDADNAYYAYDENKTTVFEVNNGEFEIASSASTSSNIKGTLDENGALMTDDGEIKYEIKDGNIEFTLTGGDKMTLKFVSVGDYTTYASKIKDAAKPAVNDTTEASSESEDLPEPTQPEEEIDPNKHHVPLPKVDVTGKNWTQTPEGWLDDLKGNQLYNYFNKDKWSEYKGKDDPNFPYGNPEIEWAFFGTDREYEMMESNGDMPYTYEQLAQLFEYMTNPDEYTEEYVAAHPEEVAIVESLMPITGTDFLHFYTKNAGDNTDNELENYIIDYEIYITADDGSNLHYSGSYSASEIADSSTDKYSYAINRDGVEFYWTVYPYELLGKKVINIRIDDNNRKVTIERLYWS